MKKSNLFFIIAGITILADQLIKIISTTFLSEGEKTLSGAITLVYNKGIAFGLLPGVQIIPIVIAFIVIGLVLYFKDESKTTPSIIGIALVLGGTIGNLIDRIMRGYVIDYINPQIWPVFNLADTALCIGAGLLVIVFWKESKK